MTTTSRRSLKWLWITLVIALLILLVVLAVLFTPWNTAGLDSHPQPVTSYDEAMQRIQALRHREGDALNPVCRLQALTHGQKVENAVVLVHGYTNCPKQFEAFGKTLFDQGYNVLIAPLPRHGLADRMNTVQEHLMAEELVAYADAMVDIAQGLGERVTMGGLSTGGLLAAWAAQHRRDLDQAIVMSPAFGLAAIPRLLTAPVANLFQVIPNFYQWWNPEDQGKSPPFHAYPRYSTRALGQLLRLSFATLADVRRAAPVTPSIVVVTNGADVSVDSGVIADYVETLRRHNVPDLRTYEFPAALGIDHDFVDPDQKTQRVDIVYPKLLELIAQ